MASSESALSQILLNRLLGVMARCNLALACCFAFALSSWPASRVDLEKKKALTVSLKERGRMVSTDIELQPPDAATTRTVPVPMPKTNEFSTGGFAVHDLVEAMGHGPSGERKWFKAEVIALRLPPAWPPIVVKYTATLDGVTNRLALPEPVTAYLRADHVRRDSKIGEEHFWVVGGDEVGRTAGSKKRAHSQHVDLARNSPTGFWAIHYASSGLLHTLGDSMLWALRCRRGGDGTLELVDGSFHSDLVVGGHRTFGQIWAEVDKASVEKLFQEAKSRTKAQKDNTVVK